MKEKYDLDVDIKVTNGADGADGARYGLDRHLSDSNSNIENTNNNEESVNNTDIAREMGSSIKGDQSQGSHLTENNVPQAPQAPQFDLIAIPAPIPTQNLRRRRKGDLADTQ